MEKKSKDPLLWQYEDFEDCGIFIGDTGRIFLSQSKRLKNIYPLIYDGANLLNAQCKAQHGKKPRAEFRKFNENFYENMETLYWGLREQTLRLGPYREQIIYEPKERILEIANFFPDRITHQAIMNVLQPFWEHKYIATTYACVKGRGTHKCMMDVHKALFGDKAGTMYCLKTDIRKFYDNVDHEALKTTIRRGIACSGTLWLLDNLIDSNGESKGLPIGNYTSQCFANLYLTPFDHFMKEDLAGMVWRQFQARYYYFRYMDDMVVLCSDKEVLHYLLDMMALYLGAELRVEIKDNWQIFPVDARCLDFVGFKQNHFGILLRKSILRNFQMKLKATLPKNTVRSIDDLKRLYPSEYGWVIRCSERHSNFIFNKILSNGCKSAITGTNA